MNIAIIGSGYVGLVTAAGFAHFGHHVTCIDIDKRRIERLLVGECPIYEPGLAGMLQRCAARLHYTTDYEATTSAAVVFLCVGTPPEDSGHTDLTYLEAACRELSSHLSADALVVTKSTVPVGTGEKTSQWLKTNNLVLSNPEFLKEGDAVRDCLRPDRIVIGCPGGSPHFNPAMAELYAPFVRTPDQIMFVKRESAELIKYANNAMLATRISFMNDMARLCERVGADVDDIRLGIGSDERIGSSFLYAGAGWAGSCFSKDLQSLAAQAAEAGTDVPIAAATLTTNYQHRKWFLDKIKSELPFGGVLGIWGLSFKPGTDDIRDSVAIEFAHALAHTHRIRVYDPEATDNARMVLGDSVEYCGGPYEAVNAANALLLCTEWPQFRYPDWTLIAEQGLRTVFDGRNIWSRSEVERLGFTYVGVGR